MPDRFNKKPVHGLLHVEGQPTVVFDTICTKDKTPWLANDEVHQFLIDVWTLSDLWLVGRYVIMPDHIHLFAWATEVAIDYENWVRYWKSQFSKLHGKPERRWQSDHWDRRMRSESAYEEKWNYVKKNPQRAGLVKDEIEWPYQGEIFQLRWDS